MKTIKFVEIHEYDTNTSTIAAHLTEVLKRIRKNKLAADLIGDDEKSEGLKSSDPDGFATSHELGGLTENDFIAAARLDAITD